MTCEAHVTIAQIVHEQQHNVGATALSSLGLHTHSKETEGTEEQ
jgi:hypothetical protein